MSNSMLACVRKGPNQLAVEKMQKPEIQTPTDVIIKTSLSTICGTDAHMAELPFPGIIMGHEAVGEIEEIGPGVEGFKAGDRVVMSCMIACGHCASCQTGDQSACLHPMGRVKHGMMLNGCQAEYFRVPFAPFNICKIPEGLPDEYAILSGDIFSTGVGVLERANIRIGDTVAVFAQGPLGLCVTAAARAMGAGLVITVEKDPFRREISEKMGANIVINPEEVDPVSKILRLTDNVGVDIAVEAVGSQVTLDGAFKTAKVGGAITALGVYSFATQNVSIPVLSGSSVTEAFYHRKFVTTLCPSGKYRMKRLMDMMIYNKLDFSPLWTHTISLKNILEGYNMAKDPSKKAIKIAVKP